MGRGRLVIVSEWCEFGVSSVCGLSEWLGGEWLGGERGGRGARGPSGDQEEGRKERLLARTSSST